MSCIALGQVGGRESAIWRRFIRSSPFGFFATVSILGDAARRLTVGARHRPE